MPVAPDPNQIYDRAKEEGQRRLSMPPLMQASTGFIAGVTIVFGIVALGMAHELTAPAFGSGPGQLAGALAFGIGLVFLVVGRSELFTENFFDPVAAAADRSIKASWGGLLRLWVTVLALNLVGGAVMAAIFSVEGALPPGAHETLAVVAEDIASKSSLATFTRAVAAGTLLTLLSYLLHAVDTVGSRIVLAYLVGFFLALGPFDHVIVSALHLLLGVWLDAAGVGYADLGLNILLATAGNLVGGLLLMTLTHAVQARASSKS
jgi:formate/nitrite transporter FocA (FNT family)